MIDPDAQPKFVNAVHNALDPRVIAGQSDLAGVVDLTRREVLLDSLDQPIISDVNLQMDVQEGVAFTGLVATSDNARWGVKAKTLAAFTNETAQDGTTTTTTLPLMQEFLGTPIVGYGGQWPGPTIQVASYEPVQVTWKETATSTATSSTASSTTSSGAATDDYYKVTDDDEPTIYEGTYDMDAEMADKASGMTSNHYLHGSLQSTYSTHSTAANEYSQYQEEEEQHSGREPYLPEELSLMNAPVSKNEVARTRTSATDVASHKIWGRRRQQEVYSDLGDEEDPTIIRTNDTYHNQQQAALLWLHPNQQGATNKADAMASFYFLRDDVDTGRADNPLRLPAFPYEAAFMIQDHMFRENGELYTPSATKFVVRRGVAPRRHAEIFMGDVMTVNGKIWPKFPVEPRVYRLRLLNACPSRFLAVQFQAGEEELEKGQKRDLRKNDDDDAQDSSIPVPFTLLGSDQGMVFPFQKSSAKLTSIVMEPSARMDVLVDFSHMAGRRIMMINTAGDEPFRGDASTRGQSFFNHTHEIMAFDVELEMNSAMVSLAGDEYKDEIKVRSKEPKLKAAKKQAKDEQYLVDRVRKVAVLEGRDASQQPMTILGTAEIAMDASGNPLLWPDTEPYQRAGLAGLPMEGSMTPSAPVTENIPLNSTEVWEIWNWSPIAHPIHVSSAAMGVLSRHEIVVDSNISITGEPAGDGGYLESQKLVLEDGSIGVGYKVINPTMKEEAVSEEDNLFAFADGFPRDVVAALPFQGTVVEESQLLLARLLDDSNMDVSISFFPAVTRIAMKFDRPGDFFWRSQLRPLQQEDNPRDMTLRKIRVSDVVEDLLEQESLLDQPEVAQLEAGENLGQQQAMQEIQDYYAPSNQYDATTEEEAAEVEDQKQDRKNKKDKGDGDANEDVVVTEDESGGEDDDGDDYYPPYDVAADAGAETDGDVNKREKEQVESSESYEYADPDDYYPPYETETDGGDKKRQKKQKKQDESIDSNEYADPVEDSSDAEANDPVEVSEDNEAVEEGEDYPPYQDESSGAGNDSANPVEDSTDSEAYNPVEDSGDNEPANAKVTSRQYPLAYNYGQRLRRKR